MPEACILCIDTSEYMRNGDYFPTRLMATQESANLLLNSKIESNPENTIGFLMMGGKACTVMETLTEDVERVMATMTRLPIGGSLHFSQGLLIAALALSHRVNPRAEKRIVAFIGSPIKEDDVVMEKLAKKLRKDDVAVDVVSFGDDANNILLEKFISAVNKQNNSRLLFVPRGATISEHLLCSAIVRGNDAAPIQPTSNSGGFDFGVDPNIDPELAMVLRMSAEEERRRLEQVQQASQPTQPPAGAVVNVEHVPAENELTEEQLLEMALKMSEETAASPPQLTSAPVDPSFTAALEDQDFLAQLQDALNPQQPDEGKPKDDSQKKP